MGKFKNIALIWGLILFLPSISYGYKLIVIQTISNTGKTFVTRGGKQEGFTEGVRGVFTVENAAITGEAVEVSREFTVWKVVDEEAFTPFAKGEIVTFNFSTEAIWLKPPVKDRKISGLTLKEKVGEEKRKLTNTFTAKIFRGIGVSESVSNVDVANDGSRAMLQFEGIYSRELKKNIYLDFGFRLDQEANEQSTFTITSTRYFGTLGATYYFYDSPFADSLTPYFGLAIGYGQISTDIAGETLTGDGFILPAARIGLDTPISDGWTLHGELGFESVSFSEAFEDGTTQQTSQTNIKFGFGLRYFL